MRAGQDLTKRTTVAAAEDMLGAEILCLDHGFVIPIDYMGSDNDIVQAARTSFGPSSKPKQDDRSLLRYLMRHRHSTPIEMCEVKFLCRMPIFVARQWVRHRTACLTGDTVLHFDLPGGVERKGCQLYTLTVDEIWQRFQPTENTTRPDKQKNPHLRRERVQSMMLRSLDEDTGKIRHTQVVDIWQTGQKHVYRVTTARGHTATMSEDHLCLTNGGWRKLKDFVDVEAARDGIVKTPHGFPDGMPMLELRVIGPGRGGVIPSFNDIDEATEVWRPVVGWETLYEVSSQGRVRRILGGQGVRDSGAPKKLTISNGHAVVSLSRDGLTSVHLVHRLVAVAFAVGDVDRTLVRHIDGNGLNNRIENLSWSTHQQNADDRVRDGATTALDSSFDSIAYVEYAGVQQTYDIEVQGPWHNFSAGGIIVHNSVNEMSLRYSEPLELFYIPAADKCAVQSTSNRQGRGEKLEGVEAQQVARLMAEDQAAQLELYRKLADEFGLAKELARAVLPVSIYTQWVWKIDAHNLLHFLGLRLDAHAQYEIRVFAEAMASFVRAWLPLTWEAFEDYKLKAATFSRQERIVLRSLLTDAAGAFDGEKAEDCMQALREFVRRRGETHAGLKGRELDELVAKLIDMPA